MRLLASLTVVGCVGLLALACGSGRDSTFDQDQDLNGNGDGTGNGDGQGSSGFGTSSGDGTSGGDGDGTCAGSIAQTTKPKVDIIFVIDNSGSMGGEMAQVQANVNTFVQKLGGSGLDYNVIFIVRKGAQGGTNICVPTPLAGPDCADNPPLFHHINQSVASSNSLQLALSTYDSPTAALAWNKHLRMDAFKVFVEVSDDGRTDQEHTAFDAALIAKGAGQFGTAAKRNYVFHAICGWDPAKPITDGAKCGTADGAGMEYRRLATLTGGIIDSVCKTDYSGVLDNIGKGIVDRLACELGYPTAQAADPTKVQVRLTPPAGAAQTLVQVTDATKCATNPTGWYYDDPAKPAKIILCKSICDTANSVQGSKIEALVGCKGSGPK